MAKQGKIIDLGKKRDLVQLAVKVKEMLRIEREAETLPELRLEVARGLVEARKQWPERGPKARGWGEYIASVGLSQPRAWELMQLVLSPEEVSSDPMKPDRDTWCTPKWITDAIGRFDLDPCANARSHVNARETCVLDRGEDGLAVARDVGDERRVFINPPYSDVMPWVQAYKHTRFCFLLKFDPSTAWCEDLMGSTSLVLFPRRTRVEFEPPDGVDGGSNPFPHALFYARTEDATDEIRALCYEWRVRAAR